MMTQELKKKKKEIKFGGLFIKKKKTKEMYREGEGSEIEDRKIQQEGKQKGIVFVLWPNSLEQLSS